MRAGVYESPWLGASATILKIQADFADLQCIRELRQLDSGAQLDLVEQLLEARICRFRPGRLGLGGEIGERAAVEGAREKAVLKLAKAVQDAAAARHRLAPFRRRIFDFLQGEEAADGAGRRRFGRRGRGFAAELLGEAAAADARRLVAAAADGGTERAIRIDSHSQSSRPGGTFATVN